MNLSDVERLIERKDTKGIVKSVNYLRDKDNGQLTNLVIEMTYSGGFISAFDDINNFIVIDKGLKLDDKVEVMIIDGIIYWKKSDRLKEFYVPFSIDETQILNPVNETPIIRIYVSGSSVYNSFSCFDEAMKYYRTCKDELNLETPLVAFKGLEIDLWDIRED